MAGATVHLFYERRVLTAASLALDAGVGVNPFNGRRVMADATGKFRFDALFPGEPFFLTFQKGPALFGPQRAKAPKHTAAKPGDALDLGELRLEPLEMADPE